MPGLGNGLHRQPDHDLGLTTGITVIGKGTIIPPNTKVGRNVVVGSDLNDDVFQSDTIKSGDLFHVDAVMD